ncbi:MAG: type II toxin-antitoxin system VapC family toxin [Candidatus Omnitrophica bacterium]|nr:type II toxin-antitoxin system VapC family toxin [Candidatus Omnitrophota bacterium]
MKRETIYIDTSIPSAYFDLREPEKMAITRQFWKDVGQRYKLYLSNITIAELEADEEEKRIKYRELIKNISVLEISSGINKIVEIYLKSKIIPVKFRIDAIHMAVAVFYRIDYFVTWNCRHLAGAHKRKQIREFNLRQGLFFPEIIIPTEIVEEGL